MSYIRLQYTQNPSSAAQQNQWTKHSHSGGQCKAKGHQQLYVCAKKPEFGLTTEAVSAVLLA